MKAAVLTAVLVAMAAAAAALSLRSVRRDRVLHPMSAPAGRTVERRARRDRRGPVRAVLVGSVAVAAFTVVAGPPGGAVALMAAMAAPSVLRRRRRARFDAALEAQLAGAVSALSAALRSGLSLSQALRFAEDESSPPLASQLRVLIEDEELGLPLDAALADWERTSDSDDVRLVANVLRLRMGAGLPAVLDQVGVSLRARQSARRELHSLTAQARLSGTILALLPVGFFLFLSATSRDEMATAYGTPAGIAAIVGGLVLQAGAFFWIRRLVGMEPS